MRVLMLGWEFPPFITGGLGTACHGLAQAMSNLQTHILFVLPKAVDPVDQAHKGKGTSSDGKHLFLKGNPSQLSPNAPKRKSVHSPGVLRFAHVDAVLPNPYDAIPATDYVPPLTPRRNRQPLNPEEFPSGDGTLRVTGAGLSGGYDIDLLAQIREYAERCVELVKDESFDIIHAHDWITYPAAIRLADATGKPIIAHIHATEFDRSGQFVNPTVFEIERQGMLRASRVVAVSGRTREFVVERYGVPAERVEVVHNGIEIPAMPEMRKVDTIAKRPTVLFLGRITMQKGPEYFIEAARMVATEVTNVRIVMAGSGDLLEQIKDRVHQLGLDDNVEFPGFLRGAAVHEAYRDAQVYVMPSVSEPFGLTALEAAGLGTPVVLSKSSGVAEVLNRGALKVDFWDTKLMARMIVALLKFPGLATALSKGGIEEVQKLTWDTAARMCLALYREHAPLSEEVRDVLLTEELASLKDEIEVLKALEGES